MTKLVATKKPIKRLPPSPKNILIFLLLEKLKNRNAIKLDTTITSHCVLGSLKPVAPKIKRANNEIITRLEARPSQPSIMLIAFVRPTIANNVNGIESKPNSMELEKPSGVPKLVMTQSVAMMKINVINVWKNNFLDACRSNLSSTMPNTSIKPPHIMIVTRLIEKVSKKINSVRRLERKIDIPPISGI